LRYSKTSRIVRFESWVSRGYDQLDRRERAPVLLQLDLLRGLALVGALELLAVGLEDLQGVRQRGRAGVAPVLAEAAGDRVGHLLEGRDGFGLGVEGREVGLEEAVEQVQAPRRLGAQRVEREPVFELEAERREEPLLVVVVEQLEALVCQDYELVGQRAVGAFGEPARVPADERPTCPWTAAAADRASRRESRSAGVC
jgi:hypothetical protein